jgi:glycosyltransferase involved in cell wall biosynthesis
MRILFTCPTFAPHKGGAESFVEDLAHALTAQHHDVTIATARLSTALPEYQRVNGVGVFRLVYPPQRLGPSQLLPILIGGLRLFFGLWGIVRRHRPDVVCLGLVGIEAFPILMLHRLFSFPLVVYLHGGEVRSYVRISPFMRWTLRACLRSCVAAIAVSRSLGEEAIALEPRVRNRISVVPNGVDMERFRSVCPHSRVRPYALYAGRLVEGKGLDLLLEAFGLVAARTPDVDLLIGGTGPEEARLRRSVAARGLAERVIFLGEQERAHVAALLQGSELLVLPSVSEGCPVIALEAMAAGTPVVGSRVTGVADVVRDGETGVLFDPDDATDLAEAICRLHGDPDRRRELGGRARSASEAYDIRRLVDRHLRIYAGLERRLTIGVVSLFYYWDPSCAGLSTFYFHLVRELAGLGQDVHVVTTADDVVEPGDAQGNPQTVRVPMRRAQLVDTSTGAGLFVRLRRVVSRLAFAFRAYLAVRKLDRTVGLDVVMAPELFGQGFFVALWMRRKLITHVHTPTQISDRYNERPLPLVSQALSLPERLQTARSQAVCIASTGLADALIHEWRIPEGKLHMIPNAVRIDWIRTLAALHPRAVQGDYLLYFGRLEKRKGVHVLGEALSEVLERHGDISMVFIGQDCGLREQIAGRLGDSQRVFFFDAMQQGPLFGALRHAKLVVLPSLFENMSYAGIEAMALERAIIGTYGTAFEEQICDGVDGFLVPPGDARALAERILECLERSDLDEIGRRAFLRVCKQDAPIVAGLHLELSRGIALRR